VNSVSALIPCYNSEATIIRAVDSVIDQVDQVVVVDDCSVDASVRLLESYGNPKLKLIKQTTNSGVGVSRSTCLANCDTKYALWLDSDDIVFPDRVEKLVPILESGFDWVYDDFELYDGANNEKIRDVRTNDLVRTPSGLGYQLGRNFILSAGFPAVNVDAAKSVGYSDLRNCEDIEHLMKAILAGGRIFVGRGISYRRYDYPDSLSNQHSQELQAMHRLFGSFNVSDIDGYLHQCDLGDLSKWQIKAFFLANSRRWMDLAQHCKTLEGAHIDEAQWLKSYFSGVSSYFSDQFQLAEEQFSGALQIRETADLLNNIGVCRACRGASYKSHLERALQLFPGYRNATENLSGQSRLFNATPMRGVTFSTSQHNPLLS